MDFWYRVYQCYYFSRFCEKNGIQMIAYSPFGSPDLPWGEKLPHILVDPTLKEIAAKYERSTAQIVLRWLLQRNLVTIPKVMKWNFLALFLIFPLQSVIERELLDNLKAYEFELTEDEMQKIFGLNKNLRKIVPVNKLKDGSVVLRDGKSRHFPFHYEEKCE